LGHGVLDERVAGVDVGQRLLQVDDVDAVALGHDEALHLGVPATGLVPEVNAALEELAHGDDGHGRSVPSVVVRAARAAEPIFSSSQATGATYPGARRAPTQRAGTEGRRPRCAGARCGGRAREVNPYGLLRRF